MCVCVVWVGVGVGHMRMYMSVDICLPEQYITLPINFDFTCMY